MFVQQFFVKGLAHSSYLLGGIRSCAIVDPQRDISVYLDAAAAMGMQITHILETHLHADFISGHLDLAEQTGALIYAPKAGHCAFPHQAIAHGDSFTLDQLTITVVETPGHTPEHVSYVVVDRERGQDPVGVFCGDTLFVGDVGRPDLFPDIAQELASQLYDSLHNQLLTLPDFCEVYPAHGAGSLCGRAMGAKRTSTIGYERQYNQALQIPSRAAFIRELTTHMPPAPDHFSRCSAINREGPALVRTLPVPVPLAAIDFQQHSSRPNTLVLDTRAFEAFGGMHIPGAFHIDSGGNFVTFAGWILPYGQTILLVCDAPEKVNEAVMWLRRVGLDEVVGYLDGAMYAWAKAGLPIADVPQLGSQALHARALQGDTLQIVDVRTANEFQAFHIDGALNIPVQDLRSRHGELRQDVATAIICGSGHRSSLGASLLQQRGFTHVLNVAGGMTGYTAAGLAPECPMCLVPHGPQYYVNNSTTTR